MNPFVAEPSAPPPERVQDLLVYADPHLLVFNKPSGLLSVPGLGPDKQDCLSARAQQCWPEALIVHRLDMATSGLIVMARSNEVQKALSRAFEQRRVRKRYQALVWGQPLPWPDAQGWSRIALPMRIDYANRPRSIIDFGHGKPSLTLWQSLDGSNNASKSENAGHCAKPRGCCSNRTRGAPTSCACTCRPLVTPSSATRCTPSCRHRRA